MKNLREMTEVQVREIRSEVTEDRIDIRNQLKEVLKFLYYNLFCWSKIYLYFKVATNIRCFLVGIL